MPDPSFRFLQFRNSLSTDAVVYPTLVIFQNTRTRGGGFDMLASHEGNHAITDKPIAKGMTSEMIDLASFVPDKLVDLGQVAIGVFVASLGGRQAEGPQDVTVLKAGKRRGHYEVTGTITQPKVEWIGDDEDK